MTGLQGGSTPTGSARRTVERITRRLSSPGRLPYLRSLASEAIWRLHPAAVEPLPPSWPLPTPLLESATVWWPRTYHSPDARVWVDTLLDGLRRHVRVESADIAQPEEHVVIAEVALANRRCRLAIDYADKPEISQACRRACDLYFKMQYRPEGYGDGSIIPGGFPPSEPSMYAYLGRLRRLRERQQFTSDVYGRFSPDYARSTRRRAVELLQAQDVFRYEGGFELLRYSRYLSDVARAKLCIDLPGNGALCFRLIDYLAIGACIVGPRPAALLHAPLVDRVNVVYCADDLSDLVSVCTEYLDRADERERIARAARHHFDKYLERSQWAAYYLHETIARIL